MDDIINVLLNLLIAWWLFQPLYFQNLNTDLLDQLIPP